jgi:Septum formation
MTLREESGNAPPTGSETGGQPQESPAQQQEPPGQPQEPAARSQETPAHPLEAAPSVPPPREAPSPLEVPAPREAPPQEASGPREAPPLEVPGPREAPPQMAVAAPREGSPSPDAVAPPQEPAAVPVAPDSHAAPAEPVPGTGPASPAGTPPRRRRSLAPILIGGFTAICLIGIGAFAAALLLQQRHHAPPRALPPVFRLQVGQCVNSRQGGISSPTVVPCAQPHDAEVYARFALAGHNWPGSAAIGAQARRGCTARLGGYLNPQLATSVLAESYVFPDQGAWNAGERAIICEIRSTAGKLTGSVRGLG